jgi:hypothetical protein
MYSLTHDTDRLRDVAELSALGHNRIMDLEDVYEFDVASPAYAQFYRRVRKMLGVDQEYEEIKERLDLLFRFAQAIQRTREERLRNEELELASEEQQLSVTRSHVVEGAAAIVAAGILTVSMASVVLDFLTDYKAQWGVPISVGVSAAIVIYGFYKFGTLRSRIRKIDKERKGARVELARLARSLGSNNRH